MYSVVVLTPGEDGLALARPRQVVGRVYEVDAGGVGESEACGTRVGRNLRVARDLFHVDLQRFADVVPQRRRRRANDRQSTSKLFICVLKIKKRGNTHTPI